MELVSYDKQTQTSSVRLSDDELIDLHSIMLGVANTEQDYTILGVQENRIEDLQKNLLRLLQERNTKHV
jgi:hypothetical protein